MEEELTQPLTQRVMDPRRLGQSNSGFSEKDSSDIVCILHPISSLARNSTLMNYKLNPKTVIGPGGYVPPQDTDTFDAAAPGTPSLDLVLRLSADLREPDRGWIFGRKPSRCDFVLEDSDRKVSNLHFRIYLKDHGVMMLEDTSTNGSAVDGKLLRSKEKENNQPYRHTINNGSVISLAMDPRDPDTRFIVYIPQRTDEAMRAYEQNFFYFLDRVREAEEKRAIAADQNVAANGNKQLPNLFPQTITNRDTTQMISKRSREWTGGQKYNKIEIIGRGAFAVIYKLTEKFSGDIFAAKEIDRKRVAKDGTRVITEMNIMKKISHKNVVQYKEYIEWENHLYIIMEYVPHGDLTNFVLNCNGYLPEQPVKEVASQLLDALKYLHGLGITHRDVKPDNILVQRHDPIFVKLTDFGLSKMIKDKDEFLVTFCGTLLYCAPEVYNEYRQYNNRARREIEEKESRYTESIDVWSLAGVLFYSLCGNPPYPANGDTNSHQALLHKIMTTALDIRPLQQKGVSDKGIRFVRSMLHTDPRYRATILELEADPWITGSDWDTSFDSHEQREEDIEDLSESASQWTLLENEANKDRELNSSELDSSDLTELQTRAIPSSFDSESSDGAFGAQENYEFVRNPKDNGRLFGEVDLNSSALGSSGVVPLDHVDLPVPVQHLENSTTQKVIKKAGRQISQPLSITNEATTMAPPVIPRIVTVTPKRTETEPANGSPSLMGAEFLVRNLKMNSSASPSPNTTQHVGTMSAILDHDISLRRRREDSNDASNWYPADLPPQKRRKSERAIDLTAPPQIFWDPRDKSTHHLNYPTMKLSSYAQFQELAKAKGEKFEHGHKTFDDTMQSFRSSRSPSLETSTFIRAQSDPSVEEGRRSQLLTRDTRRLSVDGVIDDMSVKPPSVLEAVSRSGSMASIETSNSRDGAAVTTLDPSRVRKSLIGSTLYPNVGNDFQPPRRVLAKLLATLDSCLPTIVLSITEPFTSWGRSFESTVKYANGKEDRIPKKAFKLLLFKPNFYKSDQEKSEPWNDARSSNNEDFRFFMSTKASLGIWVNGIHLPSNDCQKQFTKCKYWGELRDGDIITIWKKKSEFLKVKFECYWGQSKQPRKEGEDFEFLKSGSLLTEIEQTCMQLEQKADEERRARERQFYRAQEQRRKEQQKQSLNDEEVLKST